MFKKDSVLLLGALFCVLVGVALNHVKSHFSEDDNSSGEKSEKPLTNP